MEALIKQITDILNKYQHTYTIENNTITIDAQLVIHINNQKHTISMDKLHTITITNQHIKINDEEHPTADPNLHTTLDTIISKLPKHIMGDIAWTTT